MKAAYVVSERTTHDGMRAVWVKIGDVFDNADGSQTILLDALPLGRSIQIREVDEPKRPVLVSLHHQSQFPITDTPEGGKS